MHPQFEILKNKLALSIDNKRKDGYGKSVSIAISSSGHTYIAGNITSDTNLLDISSEQTALLLSIQSSDFGVQEIVTLVERSDAWKNNLSPVVVKIMIDYVVRSGNAMMYTVIDTAGEVIFKINNVSEAFMWYKPNPVLLERVKNARHVVNSTDVVDVKNNLPIILKKYALIGTETNFPTHNNASGYGVSVVTSTGKIFWSGQYSSFEKRLNIHAEMGSFISAVMHGETEITALGVVSTKHKNFPCEICGCCRQFLSEMIERFSIQDMKFYCFAQETEDVNTYFLNDLLPHKWSSKNSR